jgi:hypothetical protein
MTDPPDFAFAPRVALTAPAKFLAAITAMPWFRKNLDEFDGVEMWALVAMCALARQERPNGLRCDVYTQGASKAGRFAHAVGFETARDGAAVPPSEADRTVAIQRVPVGQSPERIAGALARIAVRSPGEVESRDALAYVLDELLRNVLQHSCDALGAIVGAQRMDAGRGGYTRPTIQVAVADTGRGILESLRRFHTVPDAEAALEKALRPHFSGTFPEGETGSLDNAGLGLFFTSEMAKLTAGRLLLATRGAALLLTGDDENGSHQMEFLGPKGTGFPGTLAVFELPIEVQDRDALLDVIRKRATERTPAPVTRNWLSYEAPPVHTQLLLVQDFAADTDAAHVLADRIRETLSAGKPIALDFSGIGIATQSFLHALLFKPVRVAWATGARIYVVRADPAVRSGLDYLESYALNGPPLRNAH